ncbi:hypothetical protein DY000_02054093 [Brassica cretica]|uniref:Uncharacterized protein n=1 Tax=Brassica cretica TaxID=69181 RepID=A0ABQ7AB52_BRACR|nr:hypothetical protein DY000_02054093 [Brassica cretica]
MYGQDGDVAELKYFMKCDMNYYMRRTSHEMHIFRSRVSSAIYKEGFGTVLPVNTQRELLAIESFCTSGEGEAKHLGVRSLSGSETVIDKTNNNEHMSLDKGHEIVGMGKKAIKGLKGGL